MCAFEGLSKRLKHVFFLRFLTVFKNDVFIFLDFFVFIVFPLRPGSTAHCIYGFFPLQSRDQKPGQKPGQEYEGAFVNRRCQLNAQSIEFADIFRGICE